MKEIYEDTLKTPGVNIYGMGDFQYFFRYQIKKILIIGFGITQFVVQKRKLNILEF